MPTRCVIQENGASRIGTVGKMYSGTQPARAQFAPPGRATALIMPSAMTALKHVRYL